ncbi:MAG: STAS domain-containing protein [Bacteroidetes bacterium]|nr:STAS domain-containing protein [Bacteroidota bacterium]
MIDVNYNTENGKKNVVIKMLNKNAITGVEAMEFANIINGIDKDTESAVIDIEDVKLFTSQGIGMILNAHIVLKKNNTKLKIINASDSTRKLFNMTKLDYVIPVEYKKTINND